MLMQHVFCFQTLSLIDQHLVQCLVSVDHRRYIKLCFCPSRGCHAKRLSGFSISQESRHGISESLTLSRLDEQTFLAIFEEAWYTTHCGAHDGQTGGHSFHHRKRVALEVRAQHKNIRCAQHFGNVCPQPKKVDLARQAQLPRLFLKLLSQYTLSNQNQTGFGISSWTVAKGFQEQCVVFLRPEACDTDKKNIVLLEAFPCPPFLAWNLRPGIAVRGNAV